ncbi:hypothetical protein [Acetobacter cibinongensis]|uniref:hypothetical protein n=1 Tax=Acetobacter cibinongensis TaxID=146475 RepID=UPI000A3A42A4|nr:hypothetical protein [Acetobacter cibinongensis]
MAAATAKITISAVDRASSKLDSINNRLAAISAPARHARQSLGRFLDLSGVTRMRTGMGALSRATLGAFQSVGRLVPEMGLLTGAASIAGVYRLASAWAQVGTSLRVSARSMGMAPAKLMAMRNAARLSGGSASAMTDALSQLSTQKWEAINGFAPEAAAQFQALGISMAELQKLSPDQLFKRIADKIRGIKNPAAQAIAATKLFGQAGQDLLPIFQQTGKAFEQNERLARRYGVMNQKGADAAARMQKSQTELRLAVEGFGYSIAEAVEPAITPVIHQMAEWIAANRTWIAQDIAGYVKRLVTWLQHGGWDKIRSEVSSVLNKIQGVAEALGGWKSTAKIALAGMAILWAAPVIGGIASLALGLLAVKKAVSGIVAQRSGLSRMMLLFTAYNALNNMSNGATSDQRVDNALAIQEWIEKVPGVSKLMEGYNWVYRKFYGEDMPGYGSSASDQRAGASLISQLRTNRPTGLNDNAILGLVASGVAESHLNPNSSDPRSSARGAYGFIKSTRDSILKEQGVDVWSSDVPTQSNAALAYYRRHYPAGYARFANAGSPEEAMSRFTSDFLRPGEGFDGDMSRGRAFLSGYKANVAAQIVPGGQSSDAPMRLDVNVHSKGPPGTAVNVSSRSGNLKVASVTQQRAMDPENTAIGN